MESCKKDCPQCVGDMVCGVLKSAEAWLADSAVRTAMETLRDSGYRSSALYLALSHLRHNKSLYSMEGRFRVEAAAILEDESLRAALQLLMDRNIDILSFFNILGRAKVGEILCKTT